MVQEILKSWSRKGKGVKRASVGDTQTRLDNSTSGSISGRFSPRLTDFSGYRRVGFSDGDLGDPSSLWQLDPDLQFDAEIARASQDQFVRWFFRLPKSCLGAS